MAAHPESSWTMNRNSLPGSSNESYLQDKDIHHPTYLQDKDKDIHHPTGQGHPHRMGVFLGGRFFRKLRYPKMGTNISPLEYKAAQSFTKIPISPGLYTEVYSTSCQHIPGHM